MQRVSRTWRSFINGSRKTYSCLDFSGSRKTFSCLNFPAAPRDVPDSSLQAYIGHSGGKIRAVLGIRDFQVRLLVNETHALPNLTVLVVNCWILLLDRLREVLVRLVSLRMFECGQVVYNGNSSVKAFTANLRRLKIWGNKRHMARPITGWLLVS